MSPDLFQNFETYFIAILLGALMGLERERSKTRLAGLRTFILVVLFGSICGSVSQAGTGGWILLAGTLTVGTQSAMVNILRIREERQTGSRRPWRFSSPSGSESWWESSAI